MHSKSLREPPAMTDETSKFNKRIHSPYLLTLSKFHRYILKTLTMLFPTTFISASEKIGVGLKKQNKQAADFYFNFTGRRVVQYSCFDLFSSAE